MNIKEFLIKELPLTDSFALPYWALIAAAAFVILAVIVIVSAVKNSKKHRADNSSDEEPLSVDEVSEEPTKAEEAVVTDPPEESPVEEVASEEPTKAKEEVAEEIAPEAAADPAPDEPTDVEEEISEEEPAEAVEEVAAEEVEEDTPTEVAPESEAEETEEPEEGISEEPDSESEEAEEEKVVEPRVEETYVSRRERMLQKAESAPADDVVKIESKAKKPENDKNTDKTTKKEEPMKEKKTDNAKEVKDVKAKAAKPADTKAPKATETKAKADAKAAKPADVKATKAAKPADTKAKADVKAKGKAAPVAEEKKAVGKYEVVKSVLGGYRYLLTANNGQLLYRSTEYKTFDGCKGAIAGFINSVENGAFKVRGDKFKNYKFNLQSASSNNIVYVGEAYNSAAACEKGVESVKRFASVSPIIDATDDDSRTANSVLFEIPADIKSAVEAKTGAQGKWEIAATDSDSYAYFLYANNGQLLYESREYTTFAGAKNAIGPFLKNLKEGKFIIDKDKFGKFKFILSAMNSPVDYVGQSYNDKGACQNSAISVYKFALLTPLELK